jgi:hypothetical protein
MIMGCHDLKDVIHVALVGHSFLSSEEHLDIQIRHNE